MTTEAGGTESPHLRRELHLWEAVGISLALMAPSMAANINPQGTADTGVGRAVPLAFALATIGVLLIAWTFVRLTQRFNHAGSVYGFVGATLGARAGVISGWALMGTYTFYGVVKVGPAPLGTVSSRSGIPARSTATVAIGAYIIIALGWFVFGVAPFDLFVASGTIGTLILLLVYALATIGAAKLLFLSGERQVAAWEVIVPFLALVVIGYTLFRNVYPYPTGALAWYPIIAAVWVIVGIVLTFVRNAATQQAGERMMA